MLFTAVNQRNHALNTSVAYMKKVNYIGTDAIHSYVPNISNIVNIVLVTFSPLAVDIIKCH